MKKTIAIALSILVALSIAVPAASAASAPVTAKVAARSIPLNLGNGKVGVCVVKADGTKICYRYDDLSFTDPKYVCSEGTPVPGDPAHCLVDDSGWVYAQLIPATYKCPDGFDLFEKTCRKLVTPGYWTCNEGDSGPDANGMCTPPATLSCPSESFSASHKICPDNDSAYNSTDSSKPCKRKFGTGPNQYWMYADEITENFGPINFSYDKWDQDPHKCHLPTGDSLGVPSWAMNDFNKQFPEWVDATETPGTPYQGTWHNPVYDYADPVIDVPAHCPDGYTRDGDTCKLWVTGSHTIDANVIGGEPYCKEGGTPIDGKCRFVIPCPPEPPPVCPEGTFLSKPDADGLQVCKKPNWDYCVPWNLACQLHWKRTGALDSLQTLILKILSSLGL